MYRARNYIINHLLADIKAKRFDSSAFGLCCLTLTYVQDSSLSLAGSSAMPLLSKNRIREMCKKRQTIKHIIKSTNRQIGVREVCRSMVNLQESIKPLKQCFSLGPSRKGFFISTPFTPSEDNLKKISLPTAFVYIFNNVQKFEEANSATVEKIRNDCIDLFENLAYCAYRFKLFETALARSGEFDEQLDALEFSSNISWVV